ncbi:MAG TPA: alkaline phosphatase family protein [Candidatus Acidoferrum sp.]|nr:alkaline phosphatase family protein [Candidatus Acidoferrum sp.]
MKMKFTLKSAAALIAAASLVSPAFANEDHEVKGIQHFDHVFVIMMENHGYYQVINNPNEPYLNSLIANGKVNFATNYFAVGHPSLTNYLEIVGGSNFGVRSDNAPNWGSLICTTNLQSGLVNADDAGNNAPVPIETGTVCPIAGTGKDAETPAVDNWNEVGTDSNGNVVIPYLADIDGVKSVPAAPTVGKTIADQLVAADKSWKTYQESLPLGSVSGVNYSNGTVTNLDFDSHGNSTLLAPLTSKSVVQAYAVKHNPFAYFKDIQDGTQPNNSLKNIVGFDGPRGLYADLATGNVPDFAFIAPNQCDDQHGRGNSDAFCGFDFGDANGFTNGTQVSLNPGLIQQGDVTIERLVGAIHASPAWHDGRSAIVIVWDENDYSGITTTPNGLFPLPNQNKVVLTVESSYGGPKGVQSGNYYNSFSLLKSLEGAFGLSCLNHACDPGVNVMSDLFGKGDQDKW